MEPTLSEVTSYTALRGKVQRKEGPLSLDVGRRKGDSLGCTQTQTPSPSHTNSLPPPCPPPPPRPRCMSLSVVTVGNCISHSVLGLGEVMRSQHVRNRTGIQMHHPKVTQRTGRALDIDLNPSFTNSARFIMEYFQHIEKYRK